MKNGIKLILGIAILLIIILGLTKYTKPITEVKEGLIANSNVETGEGGDTSESSGSVGPEDSGGFTKNLGGKKPDSGNPPEGGGPGPETTGPTEPEPQQNSGGGGRPRSNTPRTSDSTDAISEELEGEEIVKPVDENVFVVPETIKTSEGEVKIKIAEPENRFIYTKILSFGSDDSNTDSAVKEVQQQLKNEGLFPFEITGYFGQITFEAVKKFQQKYALTASGFVDLITNSYLNTSRNIEFTK